MWRDITASEHRALLPKAVEFTGNAALYGRAMLRVLDEFPIACEHNMTEPAMNHQAWIGHAAAYLECGFPEYVTREAWGMLTEDQRNEANAMADRAINEWHERHAQKDSAVRGQMDIAGLPGRNA